MSNLPRRQRNQSNSPIRTCWICLEIEEEDTNDLWIAPCQCQESSKWTHRICLEKWIDSKQLGDASVVVLCPHCNAKYTVVSPQLGTLANILDVADRAVYRIYLIMSAGVICGSVYWLAVTYGAVTVMEVLGFKQGLVELEQIDPIFLLFGLPLIPAALILSRLLRWDDCVLKLWRNYSNKIPIINYFVTSNISFNNRPPTEKTGFSDSASQTRLFCGALMLPTIASLTGELLFSNNMSNLERTIKGGAIYLVVKGIIKLYLRQKQYLRLCQRRILNYWEQTINNNSSPDEENE